jgi:hypothetical protein
MTEQGGGWIVNTALGPVEQPTDEIWHLLHGVESQPRHQYVRSRKASTNYVIATPSELGNYMIADS